MTDVAGLVLAAGEGRRYGMPKALVPHHGRLFVESTVDRLRTAGCARVVVVAGAAIDRVREADLGDAEVVDNPDWPTGMGSSLRRGIEALQGELAVAVMTVDLPGVTAEAIRRVIAHADPQVLAQGDQGARAYLRRHDVLEIACEDVADGQDVDRPEDLP
jgi:CTP:molybdopterin cytidylyltransferase MocA